MTTAILTNHELEPPDAPPTPPVVASAPEMRGPQFICQVSLDTPAFAREGVNIELAKIVQVLAGDIMEGRLKPNVTRTLSDGSGTVVGFASIIT